MLCNPGWSKRKDDVLNLKHGARIAGELEKTSEGVITFKPSYMIQSPQIDWNQVDKVESEDYYVVRVTDGRTFRGRIERKMEKNPTFDSLNIATREQQHKPQLPA